MTERMAKENGRPPSTIGTVPRGHPPCWVQGDHVSAQVGIGRAHPARETSARKAVRAAKATDAARLRQSQEVKARPLGGLPTDLCEQSFTSSQRANEKCSVGPRPLRQSGQRRVNRKQSGSKSVTRTLRHAAASPLPRPPRPSAQPEGRSSQLTRPPPPLRPQASGALAAPPVPAALQLPAPATLPVLWNCVPGPSTRAS